VIAGNRGVIPVERLTAEDRLMLWPDQVRPQDIGALHGLLSIEGGGRLAAGAAALGQRKRGGSDGQFGLQPSPGLLSLERKQIDDQLVHARPALGRR